MPLWPRSKTSVAAKLDQLIGLTQESNSLLRELIAATGLVPKTKKAWVGPIRQSTEKDVKVITRADRLQMQEQERERLKPWWTHANGPASETTSTPSGSKSSAAKSDAPPERSNRTPDGPL